MRQDLIERAVDLISSGDHGADIADIKREMTDQEKRYVNGVIYDARDDELKAIREEMIEEALGLLAMGDWPRLTRFGELLTEQEKRYIEGMVQDMLHDVRGGEGCRVTMWMDKVMP